MKLALFVLVALPMVFCFEERALLGNLAHLFNGDELKTIVNTIVDTVGSDASEAICEKECHLIVAHDLLHTGCPLVCKSLQALASHFHHA